MTEIIKECEGCLAEGCLYTKYSTLCPCRMCIVKMMCTAPYECYDFHTFVSENHSHMKER